MAKVSPSYINNDFYFEKNPKARLSKANVPNGNNTGVTLSYTSIFVIVGCVAVIVGGTLIGSLLHVAQHCKTGHGEQQNKGLHKLPIVRAPDKVRKINLKLTSIDST